MPPLPGPILRAGCNSRSLECRPGQKTVPGRSQLFPLQGILSSCHHHAFPGPVTRGGAAPEQQTRREHAGTVSYSEYHPLPVRSFFPTGAADAAIVSPVPAKVKDSFGPFRGPTAQHFPARFGKMPQKSPSDRGSCPGPAGCAGQSFFSWYRQKSRWAKSVRSLALWWRRNLGFRSPRRTRSRLSASFSSRVSSRACG